MKKITFIFVLLATLASAQLQFSLNAGSNYSLKNVNTGISATLDTKKTVFEAGLYAQPDGQVVSQIKLGVTAAHVGRAKYTLYPLWAQAKLNGPEHNDFQVAFRQEFSQNLPLRNGDFISVAVGTDFFVDKDKEPKWPTKGQGGDLTWMPTVSVNYSFGKRWQDPLWEYNKAGPIEDFNKWVQWNTFDCFALGFGIADGTVRGLEQIRYADPNRLAEILGADSPTDWGGTEEWKRSYHIKGDGSLGKHKSELLGNFGRDSRHTFEDVSKWSGRLMGVATGLSIATDYCKTRKFVVDNNLTGEAKKKAYRHMALRAAMKATFNYLVSSFIESRIYNLRYK